MEAAVKQTTKYIIGTTLIRHRRTTEIHTCEAASRHITKPNAKQFILISINNTLYTLYRGYITELGDINGI